MDTGLALLYGLRELPELLLLLVEPQRFSRALILGYGFSRALILGYGFSRALILGYGFSRALILGDRFSRALILGNRNSDPGLRMTPARVRADRHRFSPPHAGAWPWHRFLLA